MYTVRLRHKNKIAKYRFVVPGEGPALLGITDITLLDVLKIACEVVGQQQQSRNLDSQIMQASCILGAKQTKPGKLRQIM